MLVHFVMASARAKVEAEARSDATSATATLDQVVLSSPHRGVVRHVVVRREQLMREEWGEREKEMRG